MDKAPIAFTVLIPRKLQGQPLLSYGPPTKIRGPIEVGSLVEVPLRAESLWGLVWENPPPPTPRRNFKLRPALRLSPLPPLSKIYLHFLESVSQYTMTPLWQILSMALPTDSRFFMPLEKFVFRLSEKNPPPRGAQQQKVYDLLKKNSPLALSEEAILQKTAVRPIVLRRLFEKGYLFRQIEENPPPPPLAEDHSVKLSTAQKHVLEPILETLGQKTFEGLLLFGATGSGKTEVYLEAAARVLREGRQVLVLLPEIALSTRLAERFFKRFGNNVLLWHSHITFAQRQRGWQKVLKGDPCLVVGARSALFLPFQTLGLIVVDEEHDTAYKQEENIIYNARDMAILRAKLEQIPCLLCSATPSVESFYNAQEGRYRYLELRERFSPAGFPVMEKIDMRQTPPPEGCLLSEPLQQALRQNLSDGQQSLLFLNRRGFAPLTVCRRCGHKISCPSCDAYLVFHKEKNRHLCHHCGYSLSSPSTCPACGAVNSLSLWGPGTERLAEEVRTLFPNARLLVASSDTLQTPLQMGQLIRQIENESVHILIGTQLITKGYHFPNLTLVGVIDADGGLNSDDFRALERTWQIIHQVGGRAGRAHKKGRVLIQTWQIRHPLMEALDQEDPTIFLEEEIKDRQKNDMPPFGRLISLIVSAENEQIAAACAQKAKESFPSKELQDAFGGPNLRITLWGPAAAPLSLLRGRYRFCLLLHFSHPRAFLPQQQLYAWLGRLRQNFRDVHFKIDVDPYHFL